jgi:hypothetical protein
MQCKLNVIALRYQGSSADRFYSLPRSGSPYNNHDPVPANKISKYTTLEGHPGSKGKDGSEESSNNPAPGYQFDY